jgi:hypothetical protein
MQEKSLPDIAALIRATRYRRKPTPIGLGSFGSASKPAAPKRLLMNEAGIVKPP